MCHAHFQGARRLEFPSFLRIFNSFGERLQARARIKKSTAATIMKLQCRWRVCKGREGTPKLLEYRKRWTKVLSSMGRRWWWTWCSERTGMNEMVRLMTAGRRVIAVEGWLIRVTTGLVRWSPSLNDSTLWCWALYRDTAVSWRYRYCIGLVHFTVLRFYHTVLADDDRSINADNIIVNDLFCDATKS